MAFLHAIRRHWLLIASTWMACAALTGTVLWATLKPQYQAFALLKLAPTGPVIIKTAADQQPVNSEFDIFRETQQSLMKSPFVIAAALRDPKLKKERLRAYCEDLKHSANPWLYGRSPRRLHHEERGHHARLVHGALCRTPRPLLMQ